MQDSNKRILWLSHFIPYPPKGGMLLRSYNLLKQTAAENSVTLVALAREDTMSGMYSTFADALADSQLALDCVCEEVELVATDVGKEGASGARVALTSLLRWSPYSVDWFSCENFRAAVDRQLANDWDVIVADTVSLAQFLPSAAEGLLVMDHHNIESDMMLTRAKRERNPLKKAYFFTEYLRLVSYERRECPKYDLHITCSDVDSELLRTKIPSIRVETVPNGVDLSYFKVGAPQADSTPSSPKSAGLVFVGGQGWYPNSDAMKFFAFEVWPLLKKIRPDVTFDLIGKNPSGDLLGLSERDPTFRVHGFVDDIREIVADAAIYVCPIRDGGGTKLKVLDAFSMGKAMVAHPKAVEGIDVEAGENVVLAESASHFANEIANLLADHDRIMRLSSNARALVENSYSFDAIGRDFRLRLNQMVGEKSG